MIDREEADLIRLARDREWSNRLQSQDTMHPDSPDLDVAIAWYVSVKRAEARCFQQSPAKERR